MPEQPNLFESALGEGPLPEGVRDLLFADAAAWREMEAALRRTWTAWGYREIVLPTFEYADTLATNVGAALDAEMYRFFDRHGRTLALRPDLTIPTARVVATRLYDQPMPLRVAYAGSVFRHEPPRAGRQHEFTQAGVELIGVGGSAADAEAIALAVAALRSRGPARLPHHRRAHRVLPRPAGGAGRCPSERNSGCGRRSIGSPRRSSRRCCARRPTCRPWCAGRCSQLPRLAGDASVLAEAEGFCLNTPMMAALTNLAASERGSWTLTAWRTRWRTTWPRCATWTTTRAITFEGFAPGHRVQPDLGRTLRRPDRPLRAGVPRGRLGADARPDPAGARAAGLQAGSARGGRAVVGERVRGLPALGERGPGSGHRGDAGPGARRPGGAVGAGAGDGRRRASSCTGTAACSPATRTASAGSAAGDWAEVEAWLRS